MARQIFTITKLCVSNNASREYRLIGYTDSRKLVKKLNNIKTGNSNSWNSGVLAGIPIYKIYPVVMLKDVPCMYEPIVLDDGEL